MNSPFYEMELLMAAAIDTLEVLADGDPLASSTPRQNWRAPRL